MLNSVNDNMELESKADAQDRCDFAKGGRALTDELEQSFFATDSSEIARSF